MKNTCSAFERVDVKGSLISHFNIEDELIGLVKSGLQKEILDEVRYLKSIGDEAYKEVKMDLMTIAPFGMFKERNRENLISLSGFLYFDIDAKDNKNIIDWVAVKEEIFEKCSDIIFMICLSSSGKGLSIFLKVDRKYELSEFCSVYAYVKSLLPNYVYDTAIGTDGDIARGWFVSYDSDALYNKQAVVIVPTDIPYIKPSIEYNVDGNKTVLNVEKKNWDELLEDNILKSKHTMINKYVDLYSEEQIVMFWNKVIPNGRRKKTLLSLSYKFLKLNPSTGINCVYAFLNNINEDFVYPKLSLKELQKIAIKSIKTVGEAEVTTITRKIHFHPDYFFPKEKHSIAAKLNGLIRKNNTVSKINEARQQLIDSNVKKINQSVVAKFIGMRRGTVNVYWNIASFNEEIQSILDDINNTERISVKYDSKLLSKSNKINNNSKHITAKRTISESILTKGNTNSLLVQEVLTRLNKNNKKREKAMATREINKEKKQAEHRRNFPKVLDMLSAKFGISIANELREQAMKVLELLTAPIIVEEATTQTKVLEVGDEAQNNQEIDSDVFGTIVVNGEEYTYTEEQYQEIWNMKYKNKDIRKTSKEKQKIEIESYLIGVIKNPIN